jgi:hypothetical protein
VEDLDLYQQCVLEGVPYGKTLCGHMETRRNLSVIADGVSCPACALVLRAKEHEMSRGRDMEAEIDRDLDSDLDDAEGPSPVVGEPVDASPLAMLDALVPESFVPSESWSRWLLPASEDPLPLLGSSCDLRLVVRPDDLDFVVQLAQLADMFGASRLAARLIAVLEDLASRIPSPPPTSSLGVEDAAEERSLDDTGG